MNPGDSVQNVSRTEPDETSGSGAAAGRTLTRSPETEKPLQDIQDIIDQLAAVNQQLRHPKSSASIRSN